MVRERVANFLSKFDEILILPVMCIPPYESDIFKILSDEKQSPPRVLPLRLLPLAHPALKCCRFVLGGRCTGRGMGLRTTPMFFIGCLQLLLSLQYPAADCDRNRWESRYDGYQ